MRPFWLWLALCLVFAAPVLRAEALGGGKGGPFFQYHTTSVSKFDPALGGTPVIIGGMGFGWATKTFRFGGGGGGGFVWSGSDTTQFGIGYGGVVGEYLIAEWLFARLMIGGGGYSVSKILEESLTTVSTQKVASGGFILFHPAITADIKVGPWAALGFTLGYFMPNVSKLQSVTFSIQLMFGRV